MPRRYSFKSQRHASINIKPPSNPGAIIEPSSPLSPVPQASLPQAAIPRCASASQGPTEAPFPFSYFPYLYPIIHAVPLETGFIRVRHAVNLSKFLSLVVPLYFVYRFNAWENMTACLYVAMHGTYGVWWLVKNSIFPDRRWDAFCPLWYFCVVNVMLWSYFAIPYYICVNNVQLPPWRLMLTVMVWASGLLLTFISDFQKSLLIEVAPGQLINTKFFTYPGWTLGANGASDHCYPARVRARDYHEGEITKAVSGVPRMEIKELGVPAIYLVTGQYAGSTL
ncbi:hypothetical protein BC937DRAFT_92917 [Endogone sp. FLAS-F59071]|nr:hypothetical protein BC937DRAFT_92917 [Endogone sp. FLAS-F59071]|eukprot:RUS15086.1 hypothetical protein BC937DRAFT_92917 [Endogone sp. FLAS-F59071]